jgi:adenylate kinase
MIIVLLGPPGSGKGTNAQIIAELFCIPVITTGDLIRETAEEENELRGKIKEILDKGNLVPNAIVNNLVIERISKPDTEDGYILDGYPRNEEQAEALDKILDKRMEKLDFVLFIKIDDEIIFNRLSKRRTCPECGAIFHLKNNPPKENNICNECREMQILLNSLGY